MPRGGCAVRRDYQSPDWRLDTLRATAVRLVLVHWQDPSDYLRHVKSKGWATFCVMDRDAYANWDDWRYSCDGDFERIGRLVDEGLIDALALGNEYDDGWAPGMDDNPRVAPRGGVSSWVMPFAEQAEMLERAHRVLGGRVPLVLGGMSPGQPDAMDTMPLHLVQGVQVHPYGKAPSREWPHPGWGTGFIGDLLDGIRAKLDGRGLSRTCKLMIGELGINVYQNDPNLMMEWWQRMLAYLGERGDVDSLFLFCDGDDNVDGYGLFDVNNHPRSSIHPIAASLDAWGSGQPILILEPDEPGIILPPPDPLPPEPAATDWWDMHFTADEITQTIVDVTAQLGGARDYGTTLAAVEECWPLFGGPLTACGIPLDDVQTKVAILATIAVETDWHFRPIDEYGGYDYFERMYGPYSRVGPQLGNIYEGDGARYHGRGYIQLTGRANYTTQQGVLGVPLVDDPDLAKDPGISAIIMVGYFAERGIPEQARLGNWEQVRRRVNGGLNGWDLFLMTVNALMTRSSVDDLGPQESDLSSRLAGVLAEGDKHQGTVYTWDGERPGGFDCLVAGTLVHTDRGEIPIEMVLPGDRALTRGGLRSVLGAWLAGERELWQVTLVNGQTITGTANHRVLTVDGWKDLSTLDKSDTLLTCDPRSSSLAGSATIATPSLRAHPSVTTFSGLVSRSIKRSTVARTALSHLGTRSTIRITTPSTTIPLTWKPFLGPGIEPNRPMRGVIVSAPARTVARLSLPRRGHGIPVVDGIALAVASRPGAARPDWIAAPLSAMAAAPASRSSTSVASGTVDTSVPLLPVRLNGEPTRAGRALTYDLEIEERHELFANDILVSNCSGFIRWCYLTALGVSVTSYTDAIYDETLGLDPSQALPGDIVLYEYYDSYQPGVRFPHVGLVTERADITLDARGGVGVGYHAHIGGAVRYYRRARGLPSGGASVPPRPGGEVEDPVVIVELRQALESERIIRNHLTTVVPDALEVERSKLDDYGPAPTLPKPAKKMLKSDWEKYARALEAWRDQVGANTDTRYHGIGGIGSEIRRHNLEQMPIKGV